MNEHERRSRAERLADEAAGRVARVIYDDGGTPEEVNEAASYAAMAAYRIAMTERGDDDDA